MLLKFKIQNGVMLTNHILSRRQKMLIKKLYSQSRVIKIGSLFILRLEYLTALSIKVILILPFR